jgi:hypothetical protein
MTAPLLRLTLLMQENHRRVWLGLSQTPRCVVDENPFQGHYTSFTHSHIVLEQITYLFS